MITEPITLYKQIHPAQCQWLYQLGIKSLINLRLDNECQNQPSSCELSATAKQIGLCYSHLPIDNDCLKIQQVQDFAKLIHNSPKPVLVFCGTGNRAKRLYQSAVVLGLIDGDWWGTLCQIHRIWQIQINKRCRQYDCLVWRCLVQSFLMIISQSVLCYAMLL